MRAAVAGVLFLPLICGFRLIFNIPGRGDVDLPLNNTQPFGAPDAEPTYVGLPGFITDFQYCVTPPHECPNENITFWLYTRSTQNNPFKIDLSQPEPFRGFSPDKGKPWKLLVHGYTGFRDYAPNPELRSAYFEHGDYNLISLDYGPISNAPCYWAAVTNIPLVANCTAQMLERLIAEKYLTLEELHVVGFSLGAQVSGHLHLFMQSGVIPRITGLDPAMPFFITRTRLFKLSEGDADFVDIIHTNAGQRGVWNQIGHVDFFVNGGYFQPGCSENEYGSFSSCNHARAVRYYAESINSEKGFWGVPCGSTVTYSWGWCPANETNEVIMGEYTPNTARGSYYLSTESSPPFALGKQLPPSEEEQT